MTLVLYDDARARTFEPYALTRPLGELRAGVELIRRRWEQSLGLEATGAIVATHLAHFEEFDAPPAASGILHAGTVIANARSAPALAGAPATAGAWRIGGRIAAVRLADAIDVATLADGSRSLDSLVSTDADICDVHGWWVDEVWDLIRHLAPMLHDDIGTLGLTLSVEDGSAFTRLGEHPVFVEEGATIEPFVVFDATAGAILVRRGATVHAFTRLVGPCFVGEDALIAGGRVATCSVGEQARVCGEVSTTIFVGHANKAHDGFVGHSILGRWVNLGASTVTSNMKNTYGSVGLWTPSGIRDTGMQFLGTFFGDHAKTAIGTRMTTGSVVGAAANVFGTPLAPKVVPPFAWGVESGAPIYDLDKFLAVAERVMARRHVTLGDGGRRQLAVAYAARWHSAP